MGDSVLLSKQVEDQKGSLDLAVVILTYNEAVHIARSITSVRKIASDILVVDSYSTDSTVEIALSLGARVLQNPFVNHSKQFQWGLENGEINAKWIMRLDADEIIESDLEAEIQLRLPVLSDDVVGINFDRKHIFMGRWVKYGGRYPLRLLRIWRRGYGRIENRWMDEHIVVWGGETINFKGGFSDANEHDLSFFTLKHDKYATHEAVDVLGHRYNLFIRDESLNSRTGSRQAAFKRSVKELIYNKLPFWAGPLGYFLYRYIIQLGFLDGRSGLIYHFLQGFWYRFLVGAKIYEYERELSPLTSAAERLAMLEKLTGKVLVSRPDKPE